MKPYSQMTLDDLGWNAGFAAEFATLKCANWQPARLIRDNKISYGALLAGAEELDVVMGGKVYHDAKTDAELPAVGDWVALECGAEGGENVIRARLTRQSCFSRKVPGDSAEEQVIGANVDYVVVVTEPGVDLNLRRLERYLALIARSGARAVVLLNKCDLHEDAEIQEATRSIQALDSEVAVHCISARRRKGLKAVRDLLRPKVTAAFVGSSGVGKSTLVNRLLGDEWQWTGEVNEVTGKGRHTTSARELLLLPSGGMIIDNPGMKEVQMWTDENTLRERFADIEALAATCQFQDCKHQSDRGCAIQEAVRQGGLDPGRHAGYLKLDEEIARLRQRRRKRQMTLERRDKRDHRIKARNREDRIDQAAELRPNGHGHRF